MSDTLRVSNLYSSQVGIGTANPGATLQINDNSTTAASYPFMIYTPNLSTGGSQYLYFGTANSANNVAQLGFCNVGIGSTSNYAFLQINGKANIMTWQASSGNVGIGITNPANTLHVYNANSGYGITVDSPAASTCQFQANSAGTQSWAIYRQANTTNLGIYMSTLGATALTILGSNGYVGIGTASPDYPLTVKGVVEIIDVSTTQKYAIYSDTSRLQINPRTTSGAYSLDGIVMNASGYVGIGTGSNPSDILHTYLTPTNVIRMQTSGSDSGYIVANYDNLALSSNYSSTGARTNVGRGSSQIMIYAPTAGGLITFNTSPSVNTAVQERMRIDSSGNVGIGTANPGYKLHVYGSMRLDRAAAAYSSTLSNTTYAAGTWYTIISPGSLTVQDGVYLISMQWNANPGTNPWYLATSFLFYNQFSNDVNTNQLSGSTVPTSYHATNNGGDWQLSVRGTTAVSSLSGLQWKSNTALPAGNWVIYAQLISL